MATITEINFTAIASIITACVAATPPILTTATNVALQIRGLTQKNRSKALRVLRITRTPVDEKQWRRVKKHFFTYICLLIAFALFIAVNTLLYRFGYSYLTLSKFGIVGTLLGFEINIIVLLNFLFFCFYSVAFRNAYKRMGKTSHQARYFLFKKALLVVEADVKSTINRCHETLKLLGAGVVEFNPESGLMEAYTNNELVSAFGGLYRIRLSENIGKYVHTHLEVEFLTDISDEVAKLTSASNTNRFIRTFTGGD